MPDRAPAPAVAQEVPCSDRMTEYDRRHCDTDIRLLDVNDEPQRAGQALESHMARARWTCDVGYRHLVSGDYPGGENRFAESLELLRSLGIPIVPHGRTTRR